MPESRWSFVRILRLAKKIKSNNKVRIRQKIVSNTNGQNIGRDLNQYFGPLTDRFDLFSVFSDIDTKIRKEIGNPISPTSDGKVVNFSSARIFSSLIYSGIEPEVAYQLVLDVDNFISEE